MKIEGQVAMRAGFEEEINNYNRLNSKKIELLPFVAGEGRKGVLNQITQFNEQIKKNPDALVIQPTDNSALAQGLLFANQNHIPVIAYDQYIVDGKMTAFVTSDNYGAGRDVGDYIDSLFPRNMEMRIVVFEYPRVSSTTNRVDGFFDSLRSHSRKFQVLKRYEAVDPVSGQVAVKKFLADFPVKNSVDVVLSVNDGGGLSIVKGLLEKGRTEIIHGTFDGDPLSIAHIKNKKITVVNSAQYCAELGRIAARNLIAVLSNKSFSKRTRIPTFAVTSRSLPQYAGWMGIPVYKKETVKKSFTKPLKNSKGAIVVKIGMAPLCPYLCEKGPGVWSGYIYDILKEVSLKKGFEFEIESISNSRLLDSLRSRRVHYIVIPQYLVRYDSDVRIVSQKLGLNYTGALVHADAPKTLIDFDYLKNKKAIFSDMGMELEKDFSSKKIKYTALTGFDVGDRLTKFIVEKRVDVALGDYNVLRYSLLLRSQSRLQVLPTSLSGFNSLVLVSNPREPHFGNLAVYLNEWMEESRANGALDKILSRYNLTDWEITEY